MAAVTLLTLAQESTTAWVGDWRLASLVMSALLIFVWLRWAVRRVRQRGKRANKGHLDETPFA